TTTSTTSSTTTTSTTSTTTSTITTTVPPVVATVTMSEYAMAPTTVTIPAGGTVRWVNGGSQPHDATSGVDPTPDGAWASPQLAPGESWSRTFDAPGTYPYFCTLHPTLMPGTVVVEG
ncbi:MAG TPA: hypothetical protein ENK55_02750, partial [Actinobacteria bacterium]|nr:hypothetical protein [Actinomycetota bacterium]